MRLSEWRRSAPTREAMSTKVVDVIEAVLRTLGAAQDADCWVVWGDEPSVRSVVLVPTDAGLIVCHVRVNIPQEGPRAAAKLVRWNRVQLGELGLETQGGRRLVTFQVEGHVLRGVDADADAVGAFAVRLIGAADGRTISPVGGTSRSARTVRAGSRSAARAGPTGSGSAPRARQAPRPTT